MHIINCLAKNLPFLVGTSYLTLGCLKNFGSQDGSEPLALMRVRVTEHLINYIIKDQNTLFYLKYFTIYFSQKIGYRIANHHHHSDSSRYNRHLKEHSTSVRTNGMTLTTSNGMNLSPSMRERPGSLRNNITKSFNKKKFKNLYIFQKSTNTARQGFFTNIYKPTFFNHRFLPTFLTTHCLTKYF